MNHPAPSIASYFPAEYNEKQQTVVVPRALHGDAKEIGQEEPLPHPAWGKIRSRGEQLILVTSDLSDVEELADFALVELHEPRRQPNKLRKDACKALLDRCHRIAELEIIGDYHVMAKAWRSSPLVGAKFAYKDA